jgi:hypothetical protein
MFNMPKHNNKRRISRKNLETHGIYYTDNVYCPPNILLPEHVDAVRETLLSFENIVPEGGWQKTLQKEVEMLACDDIAPQALYPPASSLVLLESHETDRNEKSPQWNAAYEELMVCREIAIKAQQMAADSEDGWANFWRRNTFTLVSEKARDQPGFQ